MWICCMLVRASLYLRREENQCRCCWMIYCTYNLLNMFRALIFPLSGARDYTCVITAYGVWCPGCWWSAVRCRAALYASGIREAARAASLIPPPTTETLHTICDNNTSIVTSSWWWACKCPKHVEQIISAINHSVTSRRFSSVRILSHMLGESG